MGRAEWWVGFSEVVCCGTKNIYSVGKNHISGSEPSVCSQLLEGSSLYLLYTDSSLAVCYQSIVLILPPAFPVLVYWHIPTSINFKNSH